MLINEGMVEFPSFVREFEVNMMPFLSDDKASLPEELHRYWPIIKKINTTPVAYLSVHSSIVKKGKTQRRSGIHTEATSIASWGGDWGGSGVWMASTDGSCRVWNIELNTDDAMGHVNLADISDQGIRSLQLDANCLYHISDRTPHEALPVKKSGPRQWIRVVADEIGVWYSKHSTKNPKGILPNAPIVDYDKFKKFL